ncbi:DUF1670 domain-containing protein [Bacteroidales bacterium OttesenSCG-928-L14]|nr:DUF1670 domain-containing protein [Bacteroidales bacterium OttesenSCG-928-L14]
MINNSSLNKFVRLEQKQLNTHFENRLKEGMNCSTFEAKAILNLIYEVFGSVLENSSSLKPGQIIFETVSVENSPREKLSQCQMQTVILTLDAGSEDLNIRSQYGVIALRRYRLERMSNEAFQQGGLLTVEDIANRLLNCGERTVIRDIKALKDNGIILPLRSVIKDMGRSLSHREQIVKYWLQGMEFSEISRSTNHSVEAVANYVEKFKRVVCLAKDNHEINTISFLVKISKALAQQYYDLYRGLNIVAHREKELDELIKKNIVQP